MKHSNYFAIGSPPAVQQDYDTFYLVPGTSLSSIGNIVDNGMSCHRTGYDRLWLAQHTQVWGGKIDGNDRRNRVYEKRVVAFVISKIPYCCTWTRHIALNKHISHFYDIPCRHWVFILKRYKLSGEYDIRDAASLWITGSRQCNVMPSYWVRQATVSRTWWYSHISLFPEI